MHKNPRQRSPVLRGFITFKWKSGQNKSLRLIKLAQLFKLKETGAESHCLNLGVLRCPHTESLLVCTASLSHMRFDRDGRR